MAREGDDRSGSELFFARVIPKTMSPEQLFDSLQTATAGHVKMSDEQKLKVREARERWLKSLVLNFGNDEGDESTFSGTVVQALMLINGKEINEAIMDNQVGTVAAVTSAKEKGLALSKGAVDVLYLAALNRPCTSDEYAKIANPAMYRYYQTKVSPNTAEFHRAYYQDIFWALLNSSEFILNH